MVFGFGEGSIELMLDKTNMAFGETVHGRLNLKLKKAKSARQLRVRILAERTSTQYSGAMGGNRKSSTQKDIVFSTDLIVDREKTYSPPGQEYEFKIQVPAKNALPSDSMPALSGGLGTAIKAAQMLGGFGRSSQIKWFVEAALDIPKGVDIKKRVQVSVQ
ncbi:MAG: hypothetical protein JW744_05620 [Candidatus Diapherotrites archaeon]|uniref:Arrestin-like N-terminal domain-containing protein n=1 Tax=Candidatus Iainarchaeum sp. TaxID=3101447 RepID=A0A938YY16_9ARCH|nr:hypothetical protein [Candidatus Diapherotrites archaeon]